MPPEELRKRGLVQTETPVDPRKIMAKRQQDEDRERETRERGEHLLRYAHMTRPKYL